MSKEKYDELVREDSDMFKSRRDLTLPEKDEQVRQSQKGIKFPS